MSNERDTRSGPSVDAADKLGMNTRITRRDFAGGTLLGAGAALLTMAAPGRATPPPGQIIDDPLTSIGPEWSGPGGVGDYAEANGDTYREVRAAHGAVRNREFDKYMASAADTNEQYDLIVVGSGIAGLTAAYTFHKERPQAKILILENHQMFGGESRRNEIDVDGTRVYGAQGPSGYASSAWDLPPLAAELGVPDKIVYGTPTGLANPRLKIARDVWTTRHFDRSQADTLFVFPNGETALNPWANAFQGAPVPQIVRDDILRLHTMKNPPKVPESIGSDPAAIDRWLDSMTYQDLLINHFNVNPATIPFFIEGVLEGGGGLGADVFSAYLAKHHLMDGAGLYSRESNAMGMPGTWIYELPGGNVGLIRLFANKLFPGLFADQSFTTLMYGPMNRKVLDDPSGAVRVRTGCTVVSARHDSGASTAKGVTVHYVNNGKLYRVRSRTVMVGTPQEIGKRIVQDLPTDLFDAMAQFHQAPILTINVALRNWKFLEKMGASAMHFVKGTMGDGAVVSQKMLVEGKDTEPCDPSKPVCLTMYQAFAQPGMPWPEQAIQARLALFSMQYSDIELQVRDQFQRTFASAGFDANRDIAGIITNRQGHALITSPPGSFFGKDGKPPRADRVKQGHNRIAFANADLEGTQDWLGASANGERAARQLLALT